MKEGLVDNSKRMKDSISASCRVRGTDFCISSCLFRVSYDPHLEDVDIQFHASFVGLKTFPRDCGNTLFRTMNTTTFLKRTTALAVLVCLLAFKATNLYAQTETPTPYAIWCAGNKTLYFTYTTDALAVEGTYDGQEITNIWSGDYVVNCEAMAQPGVNVPLWRRTTAVTNYAKKVVFDASFSAVRPATTYRWFSGFQYLTSIEGIEYLNTSEVTNMSEMFSGCVKLPSLDVSHFDTSNVTDMSKMFNRCLLLPSLDVSHFNTSKVTNMSRMFSGCREVQSLDVSHFDTSNVTTMQAMFAQCQSLPSLDVSNFNTSNVTNMSEMFGIDNVSTYGCSSLTTLDLSNFDTSKVTNIDGMFQGCTNLTSLNLSGWDTSNVTTMQEVFKACVNLPQLDISHFDTSKVTMMTAMFKCCWALKTLDVSHFNTENVTWMAGMFSFCKNLESIDVSNFNTSKVTDMYALFLGCSKLTSIDVSNFDTSKVNRLKNMFSLCEKLKSIDVSNFDTSSATDISFMFADCKALTTLDLSNFDTSKVTAMSGIVRYCNKLKVLNIKDFDVSAVTTFKGLRVYTADDQGVDRSNNNYTYPFNYCTAPTIICDKDWSSNTTTDYVFSNASVIGEYGATKNTGIDISHGNSEPTGLFTKSEETLTANAADGAYWATYYNERVGSIADENTTVYKAVLDRENRVLNLTEITDKIVKKGQAVILKSTSPTITLSRKTEVINGGEGDFTDNALVGFDHNVTINAYDQPADQGSLYTLGMVDGQLGFYKIKSGIQLKARKAYLAIPAGSEAGYRFDFDFDDTPTGISEVQGAKRNVQDDVYYNLAGQRVVNPTKGVYVVNGKKVIIK